MLVLDCRYCNVIIIWMSLCVCNYVELLTTRAMMMWTEQPQKNEARALSWLWALVFE
jgi:hypothetical protein